MELWLVGWEFISSHNVFTLCCALSVPLLALFLISSIFFFKHECTHGKIWHMQKSSTMNVKRKHFQKCVPVVIMPPSSFSMWKNAGKQVEEEESWVASSSTDSLSSQDPKDQGPLWILTFLPQLSWGPGVFGFFLSPKKGKSAP